MHYQIYLVGKKIFSAILIHGICGAETENFGKVPHMPYDKRERESRPKSDKAFASVNLRTLRK